MSFLKDSDSQRQEVEEPGPGAGPGVGSQCSVGAEPGSWMTKSVLTTDGADGCTGT